MIKITKKDPGISYVRLFETVDVFRVNHQKRGHSTENVAYCLRHVPFLDSSVQLLTDDGVKRSDGLQVELSPIVPVRS